MQSLILATHAFEHHEYWRYQWPEPETFVYVVQAEGDSPIKVGKSDRPLKRRIDQLQTGNPRQLVVLHVLVGGFDLEWQLHNKLKRARLVGEWFDGQSVDPFLDFVEDLGDRMLNWHEESGKEILPDYWDFGDWPTPPSERPRRRRQPVRIRSRRVRHVG